MKPTFLVIGAAKAGTTTLCHLLSQHPEIYFSLPKELHFFSMDAAYALGTDWYESWFAAAAGARQVGECSTTYTLRKLFPHAAERIARYGPDLKLVYIARHPLDRIESGWLQLRRFGVDCPFQHAGVMELPEAMRVDGSFDEAVRRQSDCLVESTNYWQELAVYRRFFRDDQILVLLFEELVRDPQTLIGRCFEFLGVDPTVQLSNYTLHLNQATEYRQPRRLLWRYWSSPRRRALYAAVAGLFPQSFRLGLTRFLTTPARDRPRWEEDTRAATLACLRDDLERFLVHHGYPRDAWNLATNDDPGAVEPCADTSH